MDTLQLIVKLIAFLAGVSLVVFTLTSAVRMLVLPRSDNVWLTRIIFTWMRRLFLLRIRFQRRRSYESRDRVMAFFAPVTLLLMPVIWLILVTIGYTPMYWALGIGDAYDTFLLSGSSLLTLGFAPVTDWSTMMLSFSEATIGLILIALLIAYLPTMYNALSYREMYVALLEVRAGDPPSAVTMIQRMYRNRGMERLPELWKEWEEWFVQLEESHTSLAPLIFFRSPHPGHSWVTAAGTVMDTIALLDSTVDMSRDINSVLCLRAGFIALRGIANFFNYSYDHDPNPDDPISISRDEFDEAYEKLAEAGIPLVTDRDQAWKDFVGWRVNYDSVLLMLARVTMAPYAPWSSDRSLPRGET